MTTPTAVSDAAVAAPPKKSALRYITATARIVMGLLFFLGGLTFFLNMTPKDVVMPEGALAFAGAMMKTGYLMQLIKGTEVLVGALLLLNRFVPLALVLIAPVVVNIVAFHVFLAPSGIVTALVVLALELYLAWAYRNAYRAVLVARATPA